MPSRSRFAGWIALTLIAVPVSAIVMRHDRDDRRYLDLAEPHCAVADMNLPGGAGTLIGETWVLTAAHVTALMKPGRPIRLGDRDRVVRRIVAYPGGEIGKDDLALVELAEPVTDVSPLTLYDGRDEEGQQVVFVGRGMSGTGLTGPTQRDRRLRAATNRVERALERLLTFSFDAPPAGTDLEGISGPGDSGGPALIGRDGRWQVIGVSSGQDSGAGREGVYGVTEFYTRVSSYLSWLRAEMGGGEQGSVSEATPEYLSRGGNPDA